MIIKDMSQQSKPIELEMGQCLRRVPGRRAVYEGIYGDRNVIIKIFFSRLQGRRRARRRVSETREWDSRMQECKRVKKLTPVRGQESAIGVKNGKEP